MYILSPKTRKKIFLDNSISDYDGRLKEVLDKCFVDEILDYCQENSSIKSKRQMISYEIAEHILENIATYLLLGEYRQNNILTLHQIREYNDREIQASQSDSNAEDLMYAAVGQIDENQTKTVSASVELKKIELDKDIETLSNEEVDKVTKKVKKARKHYRQSKMYRLEKLYSTRPVRTYKLKRVYDINEQGKKIAAKNIFGQPIWDVEYVTTGGRAGLIDPAKPYKWSWSIVDTEGKFIFENDWYILDMEKNPQYSVNIDNKCQMDKILCYEIDGKRYFFDEQINELTDGVNKV